MFCKNCGKEISDQADVCIHCGVSTGKVSSVSSGQFDGPIGGLGILCFFFPLIGFILYLSWKDGKPIKSKGAGKLALWGIAGIILAYALGLLIAFTS